MSSSKVPQYLVMVFIFLSLLSCKKKRLAIEIPSPDPKQPDQILVPIKLEGTALNITLTYKENTSLLTGLESTGGNKIILSYNNNLQLYKLEKFKNSKLYYMASYRTATDQVIVSADQFEYNPLWESYVPIGAYSLAYNNGKQLAEVKYYGNNSQNFLNSFSLSYNENGGLSEQVLTNSTGQSAVLKYSFDSKKGIVSNLAEARLLALEVDFWFLQCGKNNILSHSNAQSPTENTSFSYEYNEEGYPTKMNISTGKNTQVLKITYKTLP